jgi:hypothetical protein
VISDGRQQRTHELAVSGREWRALDAYPFEASAAEAATWLRGGRMTSERHLYRCPDCGTSIRYCTQCGDRLPHIFPVPCGNCKKAMDYCPGCGHTLDIDTDEALEGASKVIERAMRAKQVQEGAAQRDE